MTSRLPPVRREVEVSTDPYRAFELWTKQIGRWWPMASHSVHGELGSVAFDGSRLIETAPDGTTVIWGTVTTWEPPHRLALTWHPGRDASEATYVEVWFHPAGRGRTRVTLEHTGWEVLAEPEQIRANYETGWPVVLEPFATAAQDL
ncbi:SRPBCC domain-containing protein [Aeromicrobium sp.]|uniref:SRPBCC domain-containing protein n=1 Tax=Aeromicrobium sp. TaxID=1871063 RepID=UPI003D6B51BD